MTSMAEKSISVDDRLREGIELVRSPGGMIVSVVEAQALVGLVDTVRQEHASCSGTCSVCAALGRIDRRYA